VEGGDLLIEIIIERLAEGIWLRRDAVALSPDS
jgi:hypothetical protein